MGVALQNPEGLCVGTLSDNKRRHSPSTTLADASLEELTHTMTPLAALDHRPCLAVPLPWDLLNFGSHRPAVVAQASLHELSWTG